MVCKTPPMDYPPRRNSIYHWCSTCRFGGYQGTDHAWRTSGDAIARLQLLLLINPKQRLSGIRKRVVAPQRYVCNRLGGLGKTLCRRENYDAFALQSTQSNRTSVDYRRTGAYQYHLHEARCEGDER